MPNLAQIVWRPAVPLVWLALIAGIAAALALLAYGRSLCREPEKALPLLLMRLTALAVLVVCLLGPSTAPPTQTRPTRPTLTVLLDTSRSMLTQDVGGRSRLDHVLEYWLTPAQLTSLSRGFDLRVVGFDEQTHAIPADSLRQAVDGLARGDHTNYPDALASALADQPAESISAIILIGDGHDSEQRPLSSVASLAQERDIPIHTLPIGSHTPQKDIALVALPRQDYLLANELGQIAVRIHQAGYDGATAQVKLQGPGINEVRQVTFDGPAATLQVPVQHAEPGVYEYRASIEPAGGEVVTSNNQHVAFVEVTQQRVRVLILEGEPYWDTRFLAQSLRRDPNIELVHISQLSAERRQEVVTRSQVEAADVPRSAEAFAAYDIVVLGSGLEHVLDAASAAALDEYVWKNGGHIIFARGRAYDPQTPAGAAIAAPLRSLEPVTWGAGLLHDLPLSLTASGRSSPAFSMLGTASEAEALVPRLPPIKIAPVVEATKPAAIVLAEFGAGEPRAVATAVRSPAIVTMNYGRGSVFAVLGEGLWQWGFLPPAMEQHAGIFDSFWSNVVRSQAMGGDFQPGQQVSLRLSGSSVRLGDEMLVDVATRGTVPPGFRPKVTLVDPEGKTTPLEVAAAEGVAQRMQAGFTPSAPGTWRVIVDAAPLEPARLERSFSVYDLDLERLHAEARPAVLADLAQATGGTIFDPQAPTDLAAHLQRRQAARIVPPQPQYIWDTGVILAALLVWMGLEWLARRQAGWL